MVLPCAADGNIRIDHGGPLRALVVRVSAMHGQVHPPPIGTAHTVEQARRHHIDLTLMPVPEHDRFSGTGRYFARTALQAAGSRVIKLRSDIVDSRDRDAAAVTAQRRAVPDAFTGRAMCPPLPGGSRP